MTFLTKYPFKCAGCGEQHPIDTESVYDEDDNITAYECTDHTTEIVGAGPEPATQKRGPIAVLPRGKTAKDRCNRCFIIHTSAQGDRCE